MKSVQDQHKRLQEEFDSSGLRNRGLYGVVKGKIKELYQVLSQTREERDSFLDKKHSAKNEKAKKEDEKESWVKRWWK